MAAKLTSISYLSQKQQRRRQRKRKSRNSIIAQQWIYLSPHLIIIVESMWAMDMACHLSVIICLSEEKWRGDRKMKQICGGMPATPRQRKTSSSVCGRQAETCHLAMSRQADLLSLTILPPVHSVENIVSAMLWLFSSCLSEKYWSLSVCVELGWHQWRTWWKRK